jgi:hypothetical protein
VNPLAFPLALITLFGLVAIMPISTHFLDTYLGSLTPEVQFIAGLVMPSVILLFLASWLQPRSG